jgi:hypothetical protein
VQPEVGLCKTCHSRHWCPGLGCHHPGAPFCLALSKARFTHTNRAFILCGPQGKPECAPSKWNTSPGILDADVNSQASASTVMSNGSYRHRLPGGKRPVREAHEVGRAPSSRPGMRSRMPTSGGCSASTWCWRGCRSECAGGYRPSSDRFTRIAAECDKPACEQLQLHATCKPSCEPTHDCDCKSNCNLFRA